MISYEKTATLTSFHKPEVSVPITTLAHKIFTFIAVSWALLQIWFTSPLQFSLAELFHSSNLIITDKEIRALHLAFGIFLLFLYYPAFSNVHRTNPPNSSLLLASIAALPSLYIFIFYNDLALRIGNPTSLDVFFSVIGLLLLLEAARRAVGVGMATIASVFLLYSLFGENLPKIIAHKDYTFASLSSYQWLTSEGVFGTAIGVSANFIFLYVLFGALLDKIGAGNFFIKLSFSLLGKFRAGPAKASVVASGLMGMISGSSIANTITIGSLTIPLMKKMGFSAERAGAIEVSAGVNSQIMPPIMGAAAFLIAEYLSIPYGELIKYAFLPATLSYIALIYLIHLEACKLGLGSIEPENTASNFNSSYLFTLSRWLKVGIFSLLLIATIGAIYIIIDGWSFWPGIKFLFPNTARYIITAALILSYIGLLKYKSLFAEETEMEAGVNLTKAAAPLTILRSGLHFFLPIILLVWCLTVEKMSPSFSAYWTIMFLTFMLLTQNIFVALLRKENIQIIDHLRAGITVWKDCLIFSSKNMIVIAIATATAGIIVGSVSMTGVGLSISEIIDHFSHGNFLLALILTGIISIILGMGVPTTACYIITATLMVPVLNYITIKNALPVPPVCLHLFVFYFGLMADITPPVGLATYAASAISRGSPLKTGVYAFLYNIRTILLPFLFIYNPQLILYQVDNVSDILAIIVISLVGILAISAATQNYFITRNKLYESICLLFIGTACLCPQIYINFLTPPFRATPFDQLNQSNPSNLIKLTFSHMELSGQLNEKAVRLEIKPSIENRSLRDQLQALGLDIHQSDKGIIVSHIQEGSKAYIAKISKGSQIKKIELGQPQISQFLIQGFALLLLFSITYIQKNRLKKYEN